MSVAVVVDDCLNMPTFRFLHTADWHLGRELHGADLGPAQRAFLEWLAELAESERVDAILMAGDIYDRSVPPVAAVEIFRDGVARLAEVAPVVLITGNHDSTVRMSLGPLMRPEIVLRSGTHDLGRPVILGGDVAIYPIPYLEPLLVASELGFERSGGHPAALGAAIARCRDDLATRPEGTRAIAIAHAFVAGGEESESERRLAVGGAEQVPVSLFEDFNYTALGHLHLPQHPATDVVYSGSPIAYSFSEVGREKSVVLAELGPDGQLELERRPVPVTRPISRIEGELEQLLVAPEYGPFEDHWLEITLTDGSRPQNPMDRLRARFPGLLSLQFAHDYVPRDISTQDRLELLERGDPLELACEFLEHVRGEGPSPAERDLLRQALASQEVEELVS